MKPSDFKLNEGVCFGSFKSFKVVRVGELKTQNPKLLGNFICVNPLDPIRDHGAADKEYYRELTPRRADINVSSFQNFLFEMDSVSLEDQLKILELCKIPFFSVTYSGGKSYHAVLSLSEPLSAAVHTAEGVRQYKHVWKRLAAFIDAVAVDNGYSLPDGKKSFIDSSCQNPSRLTRLSGAVRDNGKLQESVSVGPRMSSFEFSKLLSKCPKIQSSIILENNLAESAEDASEFWRICPVGLKNKIKYVDWAASEGMYPELLKLTLWAIDSTGVDRDTFLGILRERTFGRLVEAGYPENKLTKPVIDAYNSKGVSTDVPKY